MRKIDHCADVISIHQKVMNFIGRHTLNGKREQVIECFTCGCCYWFARALMERFAGEFPVLMYAEVDNHFGCGIDGEVYDITGNVTNQYKWCKWAKFRAREPKVAEQIEYNCMNF